MCAKWKKTKTEFLYCGRHTFGFSSRPSWKMRVAGWRFRDRPSWGSLRNIRVAGAGTGLLDRREVAYENILRDAERIAMNRVDVSRVRSCGWRVRPQPLELGPNINSVPCFGICGRSRICAGTFPIFRLVHVASFLPVLSGIGESTE